MLWSVVSLLLGRWARFSKSVKNKTVHKRTSAVNMNKALIPLFLFLALSFLVYTVKAESFDIMAVPEYIDTQLGCGEFIGGLLASMVVMLLTLLPVLVMTKGKQPTLYLVMFFFVLAPLTGLGWFPIWLYIILLLAIALGFGQKLADIFGGLRK